MRGSWLIAGGSIFFPFGQVYTQIMVENSILTKTGQYYPSDVVFADGGKLEICGSNFLSCRVISLDLFYGFLTDQPTQLLTLRARK